MSVKEEVLTLLEANRSEDLSGQQIADLLQVSRTAVWKAVKNLEEEGYEIHAASNRGYRLLNDSDVLSEAGIRLSLESAYKDYPVVVLKDTDSTNQEVKRRALEGARHGLLVLAEHQTAGKGRKGRGFYSPGPCRYLYEYIVPSHRRKCVQCGVDHNGSRRGSVPGHS